LAASGAVGVFLGQIDRFPEEEDLVDAQTVALALRVLALAVRFSCWRQWFISLYRHKLRKKYRKILFRRKD
jgi:hypothetical protein